jgi:hypothetical protein
VQDGKVIRGEGWEFLKLYVDSLRHAEVKAVLRLKKLWNVAGKAGIKLEATQLVLKATEKPTEADVFGDDSVLL